MSEVRVSVYDSHCCGKDGLASWLTLAGSLGISADSAKNPYREITERAL